MHVYGDTCPMCCGDLYEAARLPVVAVCSSCGHDSGAPDSAPSESRRPASSVLSVSSVASAPEPSTWMQPFDGIQIRPGAGIAPIKSIIS